MLTSRSSAHPLVVLLIAGSMTCLWPIRSPASETTPHVGRSAVAIPDPQERSQLADQWHQAEAEAKSRLWTGLLAAQADATPNQSLWNVVSYDLDLTVDPTAQTLLGVAGCTAVVTTTEPLATLDLDLADGMTVSSVASAGVPAAFTHAGDLLSINLDRVYSQTDTVRVVVTYLGYPAGGAFTWSEYDSQPLIWTLSEPYGARTWWPCKDTPDDKADTVDMRVTVPDGLIAASNGALLSSSAIGGWRTYHWQENYPIATYLVSLAIHPYTVLEDLWEYAPGQTMPVVQYVMSDRMPQIGQVLEATIPMLQVLSDGFGLYPFTDEKYGHACFDWGGGMEHQTLCSLYYGVTTNWHFLIVHELAHQWWGDLVTCASFHHIWLNEGFATWSEAYWYEQTEGEAAYHEDMASKAYYGPGTIYVADPTDVQVIFDHDLTYDKASWVVHMLRGVLGDEDFFAALQAWRQQFAYRSATTADFQQVCEQIWGGDLSWFFQEWIYGMVRAERRRFDRGRTHGSPDPAEPGRHLHDAAHGPRRHRPVNVGSPPVERFRGPALSADRRRSGPGRRARSRQLGAPAIHLQHDGRALGLGRAVRHARLAESLQSLHDDLLRASGLRPRRAVRVRPEGAAGADPGLRPA
jgi:aminopeptidase N